MTGAPEGFVWPPPQSSISPFPSYRRLPGKAPEGVTTVMDFLMWRYPKIPAIVWASRFGRGLVLDAAGSPMSVHEPFAPGLEVRYFREVAGPEPPVRRELSIVHEDEDLLVADKPHGLPVVPSGAYVKNCLLTLLREAGHGVDLVPLHRIDRDTAGLVAFSKRPASRGALSALFVPGRLSKEYRAIVTLPADGIPRRFTVRGHVGVDVPFWKRRLVPGEPENSITHVERLRSSRGLGYVRLRPETGKTHQLRVHLASAGSPILNDRIYGEGLTPDAEAALQAPLQLLARRLELVHPITGKRLALRSVRRLSAMALL